MPELPEVYTISQKLHSLLVGQKIRVEILDSKYQNLETAKVDGLRVKKVYYAKKRIVFQLSNHVFMVSFLGMTGRWLIEELSHTRLKICTDNITVYYDDMRKFGNFFIFDQKELENYLEKYGPDWMNISETEFLEIAKRREKMALVDFLLDPYIISGIGNYLKSDILFSFFCAIYSKKKAHLLLPETRLLKFSETEKSILFDTCQEVMAKSIRKGGYSMKDYLSPDATIGKYRPLIYGRKTVIFQEREFPVKTVYFKQRQTYYIDFSKVEN